MGKDKTTQTTDMTQKSTQTATATASEEALNKLDLALREQLQSGWGQLQQGGIDLVNSLLSGGELPGFLSTLPGGISEDMTTDIARKAVGDIQPQFQQLGLLDSGVNAAVSARTAGDIRRQAAEFNVNNLSNLLSMALAGQAQVQQPLISQNSLLSERLAGLRTINSTGNTLGTNTTKAMNPFVKSFQTSLGQTLGSPSFDLGPVSFGGA